MGFVPLHVHTHYSLSRAIAKPKALAKAAAKFGYGAVALTDYGNLGCAVDFVNALKEQKIKPILGCEFSLCKDEPTVRFSEFEGKSFAARLIEALRAPHDLEAARKASERVRAELDWRTISRNAVDFAEKAISGK